ncbi:MAG: hypothetical protein IKB86_01185 [Clostridia bacterium]|nr:hypothetical protein [Clostridia bacterium]
MINTIVPEIIGFFNQQNHKNFAKTSWQKAKAEVKKPVRNYFTTIKVISQCVLAFIPAILVNFPLQKTPKWCCLQKEKFAKTELWGSKNKKFDLQAGFKYNVFSNAFNL